MEAWELTLALISLIPTIVRIVNIRHHHLVHAFDSKADVLTSTGKPWILYRNEFTLLFWAVTACLGLCSEVGGCQKSKLYPSFFFNFLSFFQSAALRALFPLTLNILWQRCIKGTNSLCDLTHGIISVPGDWDTHMWPAVPLCLPVWRRSVSCSWWTAVFATKPFLKAAHCVKPSDVHVPHPPWVFIVPLLTSDHLIPHPGAFSHADQDTDVVGILMRDWKDEAKLQTAVYTTRNFLFQLQNVTAV